MEHHRHHRALAQRRRETHERHRHHDRRDDESDDRITAAPAASANARDPCEIDVGSDGGTPLGILLVGILSGGHSARFVQITPLPTQ